jgi:hypothetical protein
MRLSAALFGLVDVEPLFVADVLGAALKHECL